MLSRTTALRPRALLSRPIPSRLSAPSRRTLVAAPRPDSGPLMQRRSDRELPPLRQPNRWLRTGPIFLALMGLSIAAIFNYQKASSSVVNSTLYALRTNPTARRLLGDEVYFAHRIPWIAGELNQLHGRINIAFWVSGSSGRAKMRFHSERKERMGNFQTLEWSLELENGEKISLLDAHVGDPFVQPTADKIEVVA